MNILRELEELEKSRLVSTSESVGLMAMFVVWLSPHTQKINALRAWIVYNHVYDRPRQSQSKYKIDRHELNLPL